jgi:outer membrane protein assembly factor BamB
VKGCAWRLAIADVTGDGKKELIYGTFDGSVRCQDLATGKLIWEVSTHSFPFSVKARYVDYDGKAEVFAATADGGLYAIAPEGKPLWTFRSKLPFYDLDVGDIEGGGTLEIATGGIDGQVYVLSSSGGLIAQAKVSRFVHRLAVEGLDSDDIDEIFVVDVRVFAQLLKLNEGQLGTWKGVPYPNTLETWKGIPYPTLPIHLQELWHTRMTVPEKYVNWENPRGNFFAYSIDIEDLEGDGSPEIVVGDTFFNKQSVMAMSANGESRWVSEKQPFFKFIGETYTEFYSTAFVQIAEIDSKSPGKEIVTVAGSMVKLLDSCGQVLQEANAKIGFTNIVIDGKTAYLGSSPNEDNTVYRIDMSKDWVTQVKQLERQLKARQIGENLAKLREQVMAYQGTTPKKVEFMTSDLKPRNLSQMKSLSTFFQTDQIVL